MKKISLLVISIVLLTACKKSNAPDPNLIEHYPQYWILTNDEGADKYVFLKTNGAVMYRDKVLKTYSLIQLAEDEDCKWEVIQARTEDGSKVCFQIRLDKNKKTYLGAAPSSNKQEIHMVAEDFTGSFEDDSYSFFIHKLPDVNGVKTVALESVYYKGYYVSMSPPGFQYAQNLVTLQEASDPSKATGWQCR